MKNLLLACAFLFSSLLFARSGSGGGDMVGNGGGVGEQNFIYALTHLPEFIVSTMNNDVLDEEQSCDLQKILSIAFSQHLKSNSLKFISEKDYPGFFRSSTDPEVRLAKTDFKPDSLIYVNLDLLYKRNYADEVEILAMPVMIASLVHEFGHQANIRDHHYLDYLGSKVRRNIERGHQQVSINVVDQELRINTISMGATNRGLLNYVYHNKIVSLDKLISGAITCRDTKSNVIGYRYINQHFADVFEGYEHHVVPFLSWVVVSCLDSNGQLKEERGEISVVFLVDIINPENPISITSLYFQ